MSHNAFEHREAHAGFASPCHEPLARHGGPMGRTGEGYVYFPRTIGNGHRVSRFAHKVRYEAARGPVKNQLDHLCRNRWCCNPDHLEDVTTAVNVRRGDCTKLQEIEVKLMRVLYAEGKHSQGALSKEFGVSQSHVCHILAGKYWSDGPCKHWEERKAARRV